MDYSNIIDELSESWLETLMLKCKISKKIKEKYMKLHIQFKMLDENSKKIFQDLILNDPRQ